MCMYCVCNSTYSMMFLDRVCTCVCLHESGLRVIFLVCTRVIPDCKILDFIAVCDV